MSVRPRFRSVPLTPNPTDPNRCIVAHNAASGWTNDPRVVAFHCPALNESAISKPTHALYIYCSGRTKARRPQLIKLAKHLALLLRQCRNNTE